MSLYLYYHTEPFPSLISPSWTPWELLAVVCAWQALMGSILNNLFWSRCRHPSVPSHTITVRTPLKRCYESAKFFALFPKLSWGHSLMPLMYTLRGSCKSCIWLKLKSKLANKGKGVSAIADFMQNVAIFVLFAGSFQSVCPTPGIWVDNAWRHINLVPVLSSVTISLEHHI